ncbi:DUF1552 domain-containing protein [Haloferula chungangensis]|uniref:DUF1552 domain-containing protein n=1 Tax=Haloferula chungangensis TaxID=1048331 RepID=A0ABW2L8B3_9BACT
MKSYDRRSFLRDLGVSAALAPFVGGLPSLLGAESPTSGRKQRLIVMFSPNGTIPEEFWPEVSEDSLSFKRILEPLEDFRDRTLTLRGIANQIRGDGDGHMRGMSCLLTGTELLPGNIQGGGNTPAGWAGGISIDQELRNRLQKDEVTRTRFGSIEFGVAVPNRADPWTRMCYAGADKPLAPISDPQQMLAKLYGDAKDAKTLLGIVDGVKDDISRVAKKLSSEDRQMLDEHLNLVREMEIELSQAGQKEIVHAFPEIDPAVELVDDNTPQLSRMQLDLLVSSMANDMTRVGTLQYMRSVGQARMHWLDVQEGHHGLSHEPDGNMDSREKLIRINRWFAGELAYLARRLSETPEPGSDGTMLDHTLIVWVNELGKGNSHTLNDIPIVMVGGAPGIRMGRSIDLAKRIERKGKEDKREFVSHNRLWMSVAAAMGQPLESFGNADRCGGGALDLS